VHINFINLVARSALSAQTNLTDLMDLAVQNYMRADLNAQNCMRANLNTQRSKDRALKQFNSKLIYGPN